MPSASDNSIRAARLRRHGEPVVVQAVSLPEPGPGEVRVRLRYGGVNPIDRYLAEGRVNPDGPLPRTLGGEAAGTADGQPVLVAGAGLGAARDGVWAQAANVPAEAVVAIPDGVELREAAAMGVAGLTAINCVRNLAKISADDRVLVLGASGGVGSMIVSLAAAAKATVWGQTGSPDKAAHVTGHGAERTLVSGPDGLGEPLAELQPSVVFDPLGGDFVAPAVEALSPRGRLVSFGTSAGAEVTFNLQSLYRKSLSVLGYGGMQLGPQERRAGLEEALQALEAGDLRVSVDTVLGLEDVDEAFTRIAQRRVQGKLLLDLS
jgi:NADPH2:quinone reductase